MEEIRKAIEDLINDPEPRTKEERVIVIGILDKLTDNAGSRAVEWICHLRDLQGLPWPPAEECNRIAREANEAAIREKASLVEGELDGKTPTG